MTLLIVSTHPIQYHAPVYRALQTQHDVPISVIIPPMIVAYESGISNLEGAILFFLPHSTTYGAINATTGVLLITVLSNATWLIILNKNPRYVLAFLKMASKRYSIWKFFLRPVVMRISMRILMMD